MAQSQKYKELNTIIHPESVALIGASAKEGKVGRMFMDRFLDDNRGYIDEEIYVDLLHKIIQKIAAEGNAVILGRGSQYILKNSDDVYHVLLVADREFRIQFIEEKYELFTKHAIQTINSEDKRRMSLYRKFGQEDYDHWGHYNLILNMRRADLDKAALLVCKLVPEYSTRP